MSIDITFECEFCKTCCKTKYILQQHKKRSKSCLEMQGTSSTIECEFCSRKLSTQDSLTAHLQICKQKKNSDMEKQKKEYDRKISKQKKDYEDQLDKQKKDYEDQFDKQKKDMGGVIENLKETISKLEAKLEKFEDAVIASKKPTNTTNNNNIVVANTLNLNDTERFKSIIQEKLTKNVVCNGQRGLAKFAVENLLKDSEGKLMYKCVDPSRHNFEFTNSDGIVEKDVRAIKLKRALIGGDVIVKAKNAGNELWTREDGSMDNDRYTASSGKVMEIMTVDRDDTKFRTELSALTS